MATTHALRSRSALAATLAAVSLAAGCGQVAPPAADSPGVQTPSEHATPADAGTLVLRWQLLSGGIGAPGEMPNFSLFADGRAIVPGDTNPLEYRLRPDALRRLTAEAQAAGLHRGSPPVSPGDIADMAVLVITFRSTQTFIGFPEARSDPPVQLWRRLDPTRWPAGDLAGPPRPYQPTRAAVLAELAPATRVGEVSTWPLAPLGQGTPTLAGRCTLVSGLDVATAERLVRSPDTRWRSDGALFTVRLRPLLPDEQSCADLTRS